jgi:uncharacterized membrane protein
MTDYSEMRMSKVVVKAQPFIIELLGALATLQSVDLPRNDFIFIFIVLFSSPSANNKTCSRLIIHLISASGFFVLDFFCRNKNWLGALK